MRRDRRRLRRVATAVLAGCLLASGCGTLVAPSVRERAAAGTLGVNGGSGGPAGAAGSGATGGAAGGTGTVGGAAGSSSVATGGSTGTLNGGGGGSGGGADRAGGAAAGGGSTGGGCAGGSDIGLTATTVTLGNVSDLTGPIPGLFEGAVEGAQAWAAYVNAHGGLCGRTVRILTADSGTDCGQNQSATQDEAGKVFALVGSFSIYDACGAKVIAADPKLPDIHRALSTDGLQPANHVDPAPGPAGYAAGMFAYYAHTLGDKVKHVGNIPFNVPASKASNDWIVHAAESAGWQIVYSRTAGATETDWTSDFVKMCQQKHIQIFFEPATTAANAAKMVQNEKQAGCPADLVNIIPIGYDQAFLTDLGGGSAGEGILGYNEYALFFNADEAARIPEVALFQQWFERVYPDKPLNLYAMYSWASGRLLEQAVSHVKGPLTRASLLAALHGLTRFDANGLVAPVNPNSKTTGATCYVLWRIHDGRFQRVDPANGYRCDGGFTPAS